MQCAVRSRRKSTRRSVSGRTQLHKRGFRAAENRVRAVVFIVRLEDDDFIARIADGQQSGDHGFSRPATDGDLLFPDRPDALPALHLPGDCIAQILRAPGDGVLIDVGGDGLLRGLLDLRGSGKSGNPCARLMAPCSMACRVISRMTDSVKCETLSLRNCLGWAATSDMVGSD